MIENAELVMQMLEMYQMYKQQVPVELEEYLRYVAKTGNTLFQWTLVKPFIREKILNVIAEFADQSALNDIPPYPNVDPFNYEAMKTMLLERFDTFNGPPFTIQRLCELLSCPRKEYNRVDKFMRAVEKNILVVSTCELRSKREETTIVNGAPDRWENNKDADINMESVDKTNVITDANVLNGNETVESLLNELESMKTPETKLDEIKAEHKDHLVAPVTQVESNITAEEPNKHFTHVLVTDTPLVHITNPTEVLEQASIDDPEVVQESMDGLPKEQISEVDVVQAVEVKELIVINPVEELTELPNDIPVKNIELKSEESIIETNNLDHSDLISTNVDRVEGSIIHQTPDSDNKVDLDVASLKTQPEVVLVKSNENMNVQIEDESKSIDVQVEDITKNMDAQVEDLNKCMDTQVEDVTKSMDVQVEDEIKIMNVQVEDINQSMDVQTEDVSKSMDIVKTIESEINCDNVQDICTESKVIRNDEHTADVPSLDTVQTEMDVEPEKNADDDSLQEIVSVNEETKTAESNQILEKHHKLDENKLTESE